MDEFALIDRLISVLGDCARGAPIVLGPGDDASLVEVPPRSLVVSSVDTLVGGVHFPLAAPADLVGFRALGVSLSDLAAMGAQQSYVLIALTLPAGSDEWLERFARGVRVAAERFGVKVAGGNLARGPLNVTVSVHGWVEPGEALARRGAHAGDLVYVSGALGGAGAALNRSDLDRPPSLQALLACDSTSPWYDVRCYYLPEPRLALGRALRGIASAAIDVSDGLVADLGHLCAASGCAGTIDLESVPVAAGCRADVAVTGGDDYELCFTVAPRHRDRLRELPHTVTVIGRIDEGRGVTVRSGGRDVSLSRGGFDHFR